MLPLLRFPLSADYLHVTRYGGALSGSHLEWKRFPENKIAGRTVLVLDDILDEGHTLCAVRGRVLAAGANRYLRKPFRPLELLAVIDELLTRREPQERPISFEADHPA